MKGRIYIKQWLSLKQYRSQTATDLYYLRISNRIKETFSSKSDIILFRFIEGEDIDMLCCFLASYFEDVISNTNIWGAFISLHHRHYGRKPGQPFTRNFSET